MAKSLLCSLFIAAAINITTHAEATTTTPRDTISANKAAEKLVSGNRDLEYAQIATIETAETDTIECSMVEQPPSFPGGRTAMYTWLANNLLYPAEAIAEEAQGRVIVQFVVGKDGSITNVSVIRGRHPALDHEAIRVVQAMPRWILGRNNGHTVNVTHVLPITFQLPAKQNP